MDVKQIVNLMLEQLNQVSSQVVAASDYTEGTTILRRQPINLNDTLHEFAIEIHNFARSKIVKLSIVWEKMLTFLLTKRILSMLF